MKKYLALASTMVAALAVGVAAGAPAVAADSPTITVHVTSAGKPLAGADVLLRPLDGYSDEIAHTDANGVVTYTGVIPGSYTTLVDGKGTSYLTTYAGNTAREVDAATLTVGDEGALDSTIKVIAGATVTGKVLDAQGHALKGVQVSGTNLTRAGYAYAETNAKGAYVLRGLATGAVEVTATRVVGNASLAIGSVKVAAKQGSSVAAHSLKVAGAAKITGKIKTTGSRVQWQAVSLLSSAKAVVATTSPTTKGSVSFSGLKAGTYTVVVNGTNISKKVTVKAGKTTSFGTITRAKLTTIKGVVKTSAKKPAADAYVLVLDARGDVAAQAVTNSKGHYSVAGLVSGSYTVMASLYGSKDCTATVKVKAVKGKGLTKNITLAKGSTVTGYVKHGAKGVANIGVMIGLSYATTDAQGKYTLTAVAPGRQTVTVVDSSYVGGYRTATKKVSVVKGKSLRVATITVK